jgi:hypothetical protein
MSRSLFSWAWDSEREQLPDRYLIEVEPNLWAVRKDLDVRPERDIVFNDRWVSVYHPTLNILCRLNICRAMPRRTYAFQIDYKDIGPLIRANEAWKIVTLSEVAGAYFERHERLLDLEPVHANKEQREMLQLFCAAGYAHETPSGFFWTCEEIENVFDYPAYFWRGAEDETGKRY